MVEIESYHGRSGLVRPFIKKGYGCFLTVRMKTGMDAGGIKSCLKIQFDSHIEFIEILTIKQSAFDKLKLTIILMEPREQVVSRFRFFRGF